MRSNSGVGEGREGLAGPVKGGGDDGPRCECGGVVELWHKVKGVLALMILIVRAGAWTRETLPILEIGVSGVAGEVHE